MHGPAHFSRMVRHCWNTAMIPTMMETNAYGHWQRVYIEDSFFYTRHRDGYERLDDEKPISMRPYKSRRKHDGKPLTKND